MDARTPLFYGPDNLLRASYTFSTDRVFRFFSGTLDANTADLQVSLRGGSYSSDPDYISWSGTSFVIPNPSVYPDGLQLLTGENVIKVRAIMSDGSVSPEGTITARLSSDKDVTASALPPTGVYVERLDHLVKIYVDGVAGATGYNFYASVDAGGGVTGYRLINIQPVISGEVYEKTSELATLTTDATVVRGLDGTLAATPQFVQYAGYQTDRSGAVLSTDYNQRFEISNLVTKTRTNISIASVDQLTRFSFTHSRTATTAITDPYPSIPNSDFSALPESSPLYYVVTALYVENGSEYESSFSPEIVASPLTITASLSAFPSVTRQQIVSDTALSIFRTHPEVDIKPGSVLRDTFIDPFSSEAERIRFIISFLKDAQSFTTLLSIDDPTNSGTSIAVNLSPYKQALKQAFYLSSDTDVQTLIDNSFDQLAYKCGVVRRVGRRAKGEIIAYVTTRPLGSIYIPIGSIVTAGSAQFRTTSAGYITSTGGSFNPATGQYSVRLYIQCTDVGKIGVVAQGAIKAFSNGPSGVLCYNDAATFDGRDSETNLELATRAQGALAGIDTGTYQGYKQTANDLSGVVESKVVDAGNPLMLRDLSDGVHTGGKVDVWVRGDSEATLEDSFAFSFEIEKAGLFEPVGPVSDLKFRAINDNLSLDNPIIEVLNNSAWGFEFVDETTGKVFNQTGISIVSYDTIQLSSDYNDPSNANLTDIFRGSYRYRTSNKYVMQNQPVSSIIGLVGEVSGALSSSTYKLFAGSQPLNLGRSVESGDYVQVIQPIDGTLVNIPSGTPVTVTDERHVIFNGVTEYLFNLGTNPITIRVYNSDRTVEYYGPYYPNVTPDFTFIPEAGSVPLGIRLTSGSRIITGSTISVDYQHDENFVVSYTTNAVIAAAQNSLDSSRHATADVLAKWAFNVGVDIIGTIVLKTGYESSLVDSDIRTALSVWFGGLKMGQPVRQSDIIGVIEAVEGVSYVVVPLTRLGKSDGSQVVMEDLIASEDADFFEISGWSSDIIKVYLLENPLASGTLDGGGYFYETKGIFKDDVLIDGLDALPDSSGIPLNQQTYTAVIIGNEGMWIPGYSDDLTLQTKYPFASASDILTYRQTLTSRRVLLSLPVGVTPKDNSYKATYVVYGDVGVTNVDLGPIEYLELGTLEFTYDADNYSTVLNTRRNS